jgi:hypothetical protein
MTATASPVEKHNGGTAPSSRPLEQLRSDLTDLDGEVRRFVRDKPLLAIGAAIAAGYVVGRILAKL